MQPVGSDAQGRANLTERSDGQTVQLERHVCPGRVRAADVGDWKVVGRQLRGSENVSTAETRLCPSGCGKAIMACPTDQAGCEYGL